MNGNGLYESDDDSDDDSVFRAFDSTDFESIGAYADSDDDRWSDDSFAERAGSWPRFKPNAPPRRPAVTQTAVPNRKIGRVPGGVVQTASGGKAAVKFARPPATAESVERLQSDLKKALDAVRHDMRGMDARIESNTAILDKKINAVDLRLTKLTKTMAESQEQIRMSSILPMLLTSKPQLEAISFANAPGAGSNAVSASTFKKDDNLALILMLSGGFGGDATGGGTGGMNLLLPLLLLGRL